LEQERKELEEKAAADKKAQEEEARARVLALEQERQELEEKAVADKKAHEDKKKAEQRVLEEARARVLALEQERKKLEEKAVHKKTEEDKARVRLGKVADKKAEEEECIRQDARPFRLRFRLQAGDLKLKVPLYGGPMRAYVDWGDGTAAHYVTSPEQAVHTYASAGVYTVSISGHMSGFGFGQPNKFYGEFNKGPDSDKLVDILQWGCVKLGNRGGYFCFCENLGALSARDVPDLTETTNLSCMFDNASAFTSDLSAWNVSSASNLSCMFDHASAFLMPPPLWYIYH
jgi:surface protein